VLVTQPAERQQAAVVIELLVNGGQTAEIKQENIHNMSGGKEESNMVMGQTVTRGFF
jgi:hypothetical protein